MRLSVLDQSVAIAGRPQGQSIRNTVALAQHCEALGYDRFWVSEHHNHPTIVGTAPEIVMAAIAAKTERIRIGSAGIMLPHYSAFKVAEVFRVLDALAPGRIDMGLGRAPGSDGRTAFALNPKANERPEYFPSDVRDLMAWVQNEPLVDGHPFASLKAFPQGETSPEVWI
ncbi:MAG: MsnO8 family LLM class oxidoreductase, partial [Enhydrobacter sp.]